MGRRFWTILVIVLIIGLAVFIFLIWRKQAENRKAPSEELATGEKVQQSQQPVSEPQKEPERVLSGDNLIIEESKGLEFKPFFSALGGSASGGEDELEIFVKTFLGQFSSLSKPTFPVPEQSSPSKTVSSKRVLTDEEWFKIAYPDSYLKYLATIEQTMRDEGFISESEKFEFTSDEKIRSFLHKTIDFFLAQGFIDKTQADNFRQGIDVVLPDLQKQERRLWEEKLNALLLKFVKIAYAQYPLDCFRPGLPIPGGFNLISPCCDCGFNLVRHHHRTRRVSIDHCSRIAADIGADIDIYSPFYDPVTDAMYTGASGAGTGLCDINLGCLNGVCLGKPAIWDPMTGICGCSL